MIKINATVKHHSRNHMHAVLTSFAYAVIHTHRNGSCTSVFYSQNGDGRLKTFKLQITNSS